MALSKLTIDLGVGLAGFESDMGRAAKLFSRDAKAMEAEAARMSRQIGIAFAAVTAAATVLVAKTINAADNIRDLAIKTGIGTEALSVYQHAAEQAGTTLDTFVSGINKMQKSIAAAAEGGKKQAEAFDRLGLSVQDLISLSPDKQFEAIADEISKLGNATERAAVSQAIFGKGAASLAPLMAEGSSGIDKAGESVDRFGAAVGKEFADNADNFNDNLGKMHLAGEGIAIQFTQALLPSLIRAQEGFLSMAGGSDIAREAGEKLGALIDALVDNIDGITLAFKTLAGIGVAATIARIAVSVSSLGSAIALLGGPIGVSVIAISAVAIGLNKMFGESTKLIGVTGQLEEAVRSVTGAWIDQAGAMDLIAERSELRQRLIAADIELQKVQEQLARKSSLSGMTLAEAAAKGYASEAGELAKLTEQMNNAKTAMEEAQQKIFDINERLKELGKGTKGAGDNFLGLSEIIVTARRRTSDWEKTLNHLNDDAFAQLADMIEELEEQQKEYNAEVQAFIDIGDPIAAIMRNFGLEVEKANRLLANGDITLKQYWQTLNVLSDQAGQAAAAVGNMAQESVKELDTATILMISSLDHLNQVTQQIWQDMFSGADDIFEGIFKGFQAMLADMIHEASTQQIIIEIKKAFDGDTGTSVDWKKLGESFSVFAGVLAGSVLGGGGQGANIGAGVGSAIGTAILPVFGTIVGGILGGLVGGLFDKKKTPTAQASGFNNFTAKGTNISFDTVFGETFLHTRHVDAAGVQSLKDSIEDFDRSIGAMLDENQIGVVSEALKKWNTTMADEAITAENLLGARFKIILSTFSQTIQDFVNDAKGLEDQMARLQVGAGVEKILKSRPDLFGTRTTQDFLDVVLAFQNGVETIGEAFQEVIGILDVVVGVTDALREFADSDLQGDFNALLAAQDVTIGQALAGVNGLLMDAIANFDGSIESFQQIGVLMSTVREGEIKYLSQLDQLQKGLNTTLDTLRADILGLTAGPKTGADLFNEARGLVAQVLSAGSAEEVGSIVQQFNSLIRAISPEDQTALQSQIVQLIGSFQSAANDMVENFRADALENAASMRDLVDVFLNDIGDPLAVIAASNERAAAALEALATGQPIQPTGESAPLPAADEQGAAVMLGESLAEANEQAALRLQEIMQEGLSEIAGAIIQSGNISATAAANAIRRITLRPVVVVPNSGVVTQ